jgi:hypothetical protein
VKNEFFIVFKALEDLKINWKSHFNDLKQSWVKERCRIENIREAPISELSFKVVVLFYQF